VKPLIEEFKKVNGNFTESKIQNKIFVGKNSDLINDINRKLQIISRRNLKSIIALVNSMSPEQKQIDKTGS